MVNEAEKSSINKEVDAKDKKECKKEETETSKQKKSRKKSNEVCVFTFFGIYLQ